MALLLGFSPRLSDRLSDVLKVKQQKQKGNAKENIALKLFAWITCCGELIRKSKFY